MRGHVAHPGGGHSADQDGEAPQRDHVGRTNADAHVADPRGGHAANQDGDASRWQDRAADVRDRRRAGRDHRADVHVTDAGGGGHGDFLSGADDDQLGDDFWPVTE